MSPLQKLAVAVLPKKWAASVEAESFLLRIFSAGYELSLTPEILASTDPLPTRVAGQVKNERISIVPFFAFALFFRRQDLELLGAVLRVLLGCPGQV